MKFEESEMENGSVCGKANIRGVIVLRDNRESRSIDSPVLTDYRCSAFKQTEVDPLESLFQPCTHFHEECLISKLTQRVLDLQERLKVLSNLEGFSNTNPKPQAKSLKKKNRRKFKDLIRDQSCSICQKNYGSETALKYHLKLKHSKDQNHSQSN